MSCPTLCSSVTVALQAPLSMRFSRQEYWGGLPLVAPRDLPTQGSNPCHLCLLHWQADSLWLHHLGSPYLCVCVYMHIYSLSDSFPLYSTLSACFCVLGISATSLSLENVTLCSRCPVGPMAQLPQVTRMWAECASCCDWVMIAMGGWWVVLGPRAVFRHCCYCSGHGDIQGKAPGMGDALRGLLAGWARLDLRGLQDRVHGVS